MALSGAYIISPHRDDAAFSLGLTTQALLGREVSVCIVNCFTISNYAPYATVNTVSDVSELRLQEDKTFLAGLAAEQLAGFVDIGRVDALLRLRSHTSRVRTRRRLNETDSEEIRGLSTDLSHVVRSGICLAPLALGDHLDHRIARNAAIFSVRSTGALLGFYEDQPYAARCTETAIAWSVRSIARECGVALLPVIVRSPTAYANKQSIVACYSSQAPPHDLDVIVRHTARYGGGERLWVTPDLQDWLLRHNLADRFTAPEGPINRVAAAAYGILRRSGAITAGEYANACSHFIRRVPSAIYRRWRQSSYVLWISR